MRRERHWCGAPVRLARAAAFRARADRPGTLSGPPGLLATHPGNLRTGSGVHIPERLARRLDGGVPGSPVRPGLSAVTQGARVPSETTARSSLTSLTLLRSRLSPGVAAPPLWPC